jgi:transcriptional regulator with XRE-family HTH domain
MNDAEGRGFEDEVDDLDRHLADRLTDPRFAAAYEDAAVRAALLQACVSHRKARRLSQGVVAEVMGTTQSAVSEFESGSTDPRLSTLQRYVRALGCRLDVQLCSGGLRSGWNRLGTDVLYSSHASRLAVEVLAPARRSKSDVWSYQPPAKFGRPERVTLTVEPWTEPQPRQGRVAAGL